MTRHEKLTMAGLVLFLTGLVVTGLNGSFTLISGALCLLGLATGTFVFLPRATRNWRLYVNMGLYALFFVASLVLFFIIVQRHPWTFDSTSSKVFSLSADTRNFLRQRLAEPIRISAFVSQTDRRGASQLLDEYARYSPHITYRVLDPFHDFGEAQRFGAQVIPGDVYIEKLTTGTQGLLAGEAQSAERVGKISKLTEEELTNAIVQLLSGQEIVLYFLAGHEEFPLEENKAGAMLAGKKTASDNLVWLKGQLERSLIKALPLHLASRGRVPADATAVVIAGPKSDLNPAETQALREYLERGGPGGAGGKLLVMLDPYVPAAGGETRTPMRNLTTLLEDFGIALPSELVTLSDQAAAQMGGDRVVIPALAQKHRVAQLDPDQPLIFRLARPVTATRVLQPNNFVDVILKSPDESYGLPVEEISRAANAGRKYAEFSEAEQKKGPQDLAVASTVQQAGTTEDQATRIVAVGNARFVTSDVIDQNSWLLFINSVNWLANRGDLISIPAREIENTPVTLTQPQRRFLFLLLVIILPTTVGLGGLGYTLSRRELQ